MVVFTSFNGNHTVSSEHFILDYKNIYTINCGKALPVRNDLYPKLYLFCKIVASRKI